MKNFYLLLFLLIGLFGKAQVINFPDANFKAKLLQANTTNNIAENSSGASIVVDINSNSEIEVSEALNVYTLNIHYSNISNLQEINQFSNLTILNCNNNEITNLDVTSLNNLIELRCYNNQLMSLNVVGLVNLTYLQCSSNQLSSINVSGLVNLLYFFCENNQLTSVDVSGLVSLLSLGCSSNQLNNLNVSQNSNLNAIFCSYNVLTNIQFGTISNLQELNCSNNLISNLNFNQFPDLEYLVVGSNQLTTFDISNNSSLYTIICANNQLQYLNLKNGSSNTFDGLNFNGNPNLQYICADESKLSFIQNKIVQYGYTNCNVNTYCSFAPGGQFYTIQGQQKFDNENDTCDINDSFIPNFNYSITDGTTTGSIMSNNSGSYSIPVLLGTHTIAPVLENPSYFNVSPPNVVVNFPSQASPFTQNFCITANGVVHDVEVSIIPTSVARPGFDCHYQIIYRNKGNQLENGTINLQFNDAILDFVSSSVVTSSQTLNNLNWNYANLQPLETRTINIVLNLNSPMETPAVNANDVLNFIATITAPGEIPCNNWLQSQCDNTFTLNQTVVNSYDPNDKTCLQGNTISPDRVGGFVHYVIRFENTGTFPAENIVVKDMIDTVKFDVSSLVPLHGSHNYVTKITDNKVEFIFENINLPFDDANNDGYIAFKIKTLPTLVLGNTFSNSANIYFDYNFPIITNTATTTIAALSNPSFEFANYFGLYPNPTTNELNITLKSAIEINSIQIYNTIGQLVTVQTGNALKVDVSHLKTGNYFIKINTNGGFSTSQFIKE